MQARREEHRFHLTAWVFLPDHWHAILGPRYLKGIPLVMESVKVSSTRQINAARGELGRLWQGRFFDPAPLPLNIFVAGRRRALRTSCSAGVLTGDFRRWGHRRYNTTRRWNTFI